MKITKLAIYHFLVLFFIACSPEGKQETKQAETDPAAETQEIAEPKEEPEQAPNNTALVGIWQNLDDPSDFMEFTSLKLNWSPQSDVPDAEPYEIGKKCINEANEFSIELSAPEYISLKKSDLCWYIVNIDENNLELAYAGQGGNTLKYRKVESLNVAAAPETKNTFKGTLAEVNDTGIYGLWSLKVISDDEERHFQYDTEVFPEGMIESQVEVEFRVDEEKREIDVLYEGTEGLTSIHREYSSVKNNDGEIDSSWLKVEGIMIAEQLAGDTPAPYFVETNEGEMVQFEAFVDERYQARNGEMVTVYYQMIEVVTVTSLIKLQAEDEYDPQINEINKLVGRIDEKIATQRLRNIAFDVDEGGGFIEYKRSMEGNAIKLISVAYCSDHGCDRSTYYFSEDELVLRLDQKSYWVGNTDEISEHRRYFAGENEILCIERKLKDEGGYDAVLKKLQDLPHTEVKCGEAFDISSIDELKTLTEENGEAYFFR